MRQEERSPCVRRSSLARRLTPILVALGFLAGVRLAPYLTPSAASAAPTPVAACGYGTGTSDLINMLRCMDRKLTALLERDCR
jgi:hypothetical protein